MALQIKKKEPVHKSLRRLGRRRIEKTLEEIKECDSLEAGHKIRKSVKQCRALLRLFCPGIRDGDTLGCTKPLRKAAKTLDAARDAQVKLAALQALAAHFKQGLAANPFRQLQGVLHDNCRRECKRLGPSLRCAGRLLRKAAKRFDSIHVKRSGWAALERGIKRSYGDGRRKMRLAQSDGTPEHFHEWRKQVKNLYYQIGFLRRIWPDEMQSARAELKQLGQCLGDDHDLFLLSEASRSLTDSKNEILEALIHERHEELRAQALAIGVRFYEEEPSAFCARFRGYWKTWRQERGCALPRAQ